jgi:carbon-monoxide dehydrogenase medium subunit
LRVKEAEALLSGQKLDPELLHKAASVVQEHTDPISDSRGGADYKREMAGVCVRRALEQAWQRAITESS